MGLDYLVNHTNLYLKGPRDNIESNIEKAINDYEESNKEESTIIILGLKLFYNLDQEKHVHKMHAISEFSEYVINDPRKKTILNEKDLVEKILRRTKGQT